MAKQKVTPKEPEENINNDIQTPKVYQYEHIAPALTNALNVVTEVNNNGNYGILPLIIEHLTNDIDTVNNGDVSPIQPSEQIENTLLDFIILAQNKAKERPEGCNEENRLKINYLLEKCLKYIKEGV
jgi:hypothetical protein